MNEHWPTPEIPDPPVSAETHGDPSTWTVFEWIPFREWALSLKDYGPPRRTGKTRVAVQIETEAVT